MKRAPNIFCSEQCSQEEQRAVRETATQASGKAAWKDPRGVRRFLIRTRGHRCELCGGRKWQNGPMPLVMDHKDGNSANWELTNLRMVCPNCDATLPTYKSRNIGNGRHARMQRYYAGKSY